MIEKTLLVIERVNKKRRQIYFRICFTNKKIKKPIAFFKKAEHWKSGDRLYCEINPDGNNLQEIGLTPDSFIEFLGSKLNRRYFLFKNPPRGIIEKIGMFFPRYIKVSKKTLRRFIKN